MVMSSIIRTRDLAIDICRIIGTLLVMLAHAGIPTAVSEIRSFDVVLLVIISGICYNDGKDYIKYLWRRVKKLIFPTWGLLVILFLCTCVACLVIGRPQVYTASQIWKSFLFAEGGIGYIWIVRVYLAIAIINPFLNKYTKKLSPVVFAFVINIFFIIISLISLTRYDVIYYICEITAYCLIALLGTKLASLTIAGKKKFIILNTFISAIGLIVTISLYGFHPNIFKYPPKSQYIYYGVFVGLFLYSLAKKANLDIIPSKIKKLIIYWSSNSFVLYLTHIFVLSMMNSFFDIVNIRVHWFVFYLIMLIISIGVVMLITKIRFVICSCNKQKEM